MTIELSWEKIPPETAEEEKYPTVPTAAFDDLRPQQFFMLAVLPLTYFGSLFIFSQNYRLGAKIKEVKEADDMLLLVMLLVHAFFGWLAALVYTQSSTRLSMSAHWRTLMGHLLGLIVFQHSMLWMLDKFVLAVIRPTIEGDDIGFMLTNLNTCVDYAVTTFSFTCLVALALGRSGAGEIELKEITKEGCLLYTSPSPRDS